MSRVYVDSRNPGDEEPEFKFNPGGFITHFLTLRNRSLLKKYLVFQYMQSKSNTVASVTFQILATICAIYKSWSTFAFNKTPISIINVIFAMVFVVSVGWSVIFLKLRANLYRSRSVYYTVALETCWLIVLNVWFMLNVIMSRDQTCTSRNVNQCRFFALPGEKMLMAMLLPMICYMTMRCAQWVAVIAAYLFNNLIVLICIRYFHLEVSYFSYIAFLIITSLSLLEYQRQLLYQFASIITQQGILDDKSRRFDDMQSNELKHMLGNVAVDLKTPLNSFVQGVEMIKATAEEIGESLVHDNFDRNTVIDQIADIVEQADSVLNTNNFMLMTMNRCIEYTKVSRNIKLKPQEEQINLLQTLQVPLQCAKDLETEEICVYANPIPRNIATSVITDKVWLQENILCLLTNAVKHSTVGNVTLSVVLNNMPVKMKTTLMVESYENEEVPYQLELFSTCDDAATVATSSAAVALRFQVEDTGKGLSDEVMASLFKPSKQAERLANGTGLGLFSLARRVEAIGGSYGVHKRRDGKKGSVFWFEIPYKPIVEPPKLLKGTLQNATSQSTLKTQSPTQTFSIKEEENEVEDITEEVTPPEETGRLNILVVDDSTFILTTCRTMFKRAGHNVTVAENGEEALEIMIRNKKGPNSEVFDVVLMDLHMPIMNGLESTVRLREYEEENCRDNVDSTETGTGTGEEVVGSRDISHLLIIGVSTVADNQTIKQSFIAGVDAFIPKPFNLKSFTEVYTSLVSRPPGY